MLCRGDYDKCDYLFDIFTKGQEEEKRRLRERQRNVLGFEIEYS